MNHIEEKIIHIIDSHREEIIAFAKDIEAHPEPGFFEQRTAARTAAVLRELGLEVHTELARTGVRGDWMEKDGPNVTILGEMDAIGCKAHPMAALHNHTAHACGHNAPHAAMIGGIYVGLTYFFAPFSFGEVQIRIAEALTILPVFTPAAIPGLFIGCLIGNILGGAILPDIIFGSLATLIGAVFTYMLRDQNKLLAVLPPIISNTIIVPFVLKLGYGVNLPIPFMMLTVGIGEIIGCGVLGLVLYTALSKYRSLIFKSAI